MANFAVVFDNSGNVSMPEWVAAGDFTVTIDFTTSGTISTDGLIGKISTSSFIAIFGGGRYQIQMATGTSYNSANNLILANTNHVIELSRVGSTVSFSLLSTGVQVDSGTFTNVETFAVDLIGQTLTLPFEGNINSVILDRVGDSRHYLSSIGTGSVWSDIGGGAQDATLVGLPTDGSQWELIPGTQGTGIVSTQAQQNGSLSASSSVPGAGTITTPVLSNNTGVVLANTEFIFNVYDESTGALVLRETGVTSSGLGVATFTSSSVSPAVKYIVHADNVAISDHDGVARITAT